MATERVTITLPREVVRDVDRLAGDRSRFIREAVRNELARRQALPPSPAQPYSGSSEPPDDAAPGDTELIVDLLSHEVHSSPADGRPERSQRLESPERGDIARLSAQRHQLAEAFPGEYVVFDGLRVIGHDPSREVTRGIYYEAAKQGKHPVVLRPDRQYPAMAPISRARHPFAV